MVVPLHMNVLLASDIARFNVTHRVVPGQWHTPHIGSEWELWDTLLKVEDILSPDTSGIYEKVLHDSSSRFLLRDEWKVRAAKESLWGKEQKIQFLRDVIQHVARADTLDWLVSGAASPDALREQLAEWLDTAIRSYKPMHPVAVSSFLMALEYDPVGLKASLEEIVRVSPEQENPNLRELGRTAIQPRLKEWRVKLLSGLLDTAPEGVLTEEQLQQAALHKVQRLLQDSPFSMEAIQARGLPIQLHLAGHLMKRQVENITSYTVGSMDFRNIHLVLFSPNLQHVRSEPDLRATLYEELLHAFDPRMTPHNAATNVDSAQAYADKAHPFANEALTGSAFFTAAMLTPDALQKDGAGMLQRDQQHGHALLHSWERRMTILFANAGNLLEQVPDETLQEFLRLGGVRRDFLSSAKDKLTAIHEAIAGMTVGSVRTHYQQVVPGIQVSEWMVKQVKSYLLLERLQPGLGDILLPETAHFWQQHYLPVIQQWAAGRQRQEDAGTYQQRIVVKEPIYRDHELLHGTVTMLASRVGRLKELMEAYAPAERDVIRQVMEIQQAVKALETQVIDGLKEKETALKIKELPDKLHQLSEELKHDGFMEEGASETLAFLMQQLSDFIRAKPYSPQLAESIRIKTLNILGMAERFRAQGGEMWASEAEGLLRPMIEAYETAGALPNLEAQYKTLVTSMQRVDEGISMLAGADTRRLPPAQATALMTTLRDTQRLLVSAGDERHIIPSLGELIPSARQQPLAGNDRYIVAANLREAIRQQKQIPAGQAIPADVDTVIAQLTGAETGRFGKEGKAKA